MALTAAGKGILDGTWHTLDMSCLALIVSTLPGAKPQSGRRERSSIISMEAELN
jgi:hypothetical protein